MPEWGDGCYKGRLRDYKSYGVVASPGGGGGGGGGGDCVYYLCYVVVIVVVILFLVPFNSCYVECMMWLPRILLWCCDVAESALY